jgi:uncharacterized membrane protein YecN with MAPEG domain
MHTPITAFYAGLLGILFFYYSVLVVKSRFSKKIPLGDGGDHHFQQVIRAHGNFSEYTPIVLLLLFIAEVNQSNSIILHLASPLGIKLAESFWNLTHFYFADNLVSDEYINFISLNKWLNIKNGVH